MKAYFLMMFINSYRWSSAGFPNFNVCVATEMNDNLCNGVLLKIKSLIIAMKI